MRRGGDGDWLLLELCEEEDEKFKVFLVGWVLKGKLLLQLLEIELQLVPVGEQFTPLQFSLLRDGDRTAPQQCLHPGSAGPMVLNVALHPRVGLPINTISRIEDRINLNFYC